MRINKSCQWKVIGCLFFLVSSVMMSPFVSAESIGKTINNKGFTKGVSWESVVPLKKATFVNFDENGILDDYAYLAAVPTAVFSDSNNDRIFSNPLLFYQEEYPVKEDKERSLNARQGLNYFMEDWMAYCGDKLDQIPAINMPQQTRNNWEANNYTSITGGTPYDLANKIALN